jgi:hypothetical protein
MGSKTILTERILGVCPVRVTPGVREPISKLRVCDAISLSLLSSAARSVPDDSAVFRHHLRGDYGRSDSVTIMGA